MSTLKHSLIAVGVACILASHAYASQEATVSSPRASIYDIVAGQPVPLTTVHRGQVLKVSDQPKGPWYHCIIPNSDPPKAGWIPVRDVTLGSPSVGASSVSASPSSRASRPRPSIELLYNLTFPTPSSLQTAAGLEPALSIGSTIAAQFLFPLSQRLRLGVRIEMVMVGGQLNVTTPVTTTLSYSGYALPITGMAEFELIAKPSFALGLFAGAGVSPITDISTSNGSQTYSGNFLSLAVPAGLQAEVGLGQRFMLVFEAGYELIMALSALSSPSGATASQSIGSTLSSPIVGAGVGFRL